MKKLLFLSSFLLGFVGFASAQQVNAKQQVKLREAAAQALANKAKTDYQKSVLINKTSNNIFMGADQAASEAIKAKETAIK